MDGIKGGKNIAQLFKSKYENLFSSVPSCQMDLANIAVDIENRVKTDHVATVNILLVYMTLNMQ